MTAEWAIAELHKFIEMTVMCNASSSGNGCVPISSMDLRAASETYKPVQHGAKVFAEGVFAGMHNPLSHEAGQELFQRLPALSLLAPRVDPAEVEAPS